MEPGDEETDFEVVRGALEETLSPQEVWVVLFEALGATPTGETPTGYAAIARFVDGPLRRVLEARLGQEKADAAIDRAVETIDDELGTGKWRPSQIPTRDLGVAAGPVPVLVLSLTSRLSLRLRGALGRGRIQPFEAITAAAAAVIVDDLEPAVVIVDAVEPAQLELGEVAAAIARARHPPLTLVYGAETDAGEALGATLREAGVAFSPVSSADDIGPLLDLLRSRSA